MTPAKGVDWLWKCPGSLHPRVRDGLYSVHLASDFLGILYRRVDSGQNFCFGVLNDSGGFYSVENIPFGVFNCGDWPFLLFSGRFFFRWWFCNLSASFYWSPSVKVCSSDNCQLSALQRLISAHRNYYDSSIGQPDFWWKILSGKYGPWLKIT